MEILAQRLRERAQQLGITNAEAARRSGLDERRYAHYAANRREPDLTTLVKIASALKTTPNWLLGIALGDEQPKRSSLIERLVSAAQAMADRDLEPFVLQAEAVARYER